MEHGGSFHEGCVPSILKLGVKLARTKNSRQLIGEKIAFNSKLLVLRELIAGGFDVAPCQDDLLIRYLTTNPDREANKTSFVPDNSFEVAYLQWLIPGRNFIDPSTRELMKQDIKVLLDGNKVNWKHVYMYAWLDKMTPEALNNKHFLAGIPILLKSLENKILRNYEHMTQNQVQEFKYWLMLANGFKRNVSITADRLESVKATIDSTVITFAIKGKYKGLDLFSRNGSVLTTKNDIIARRKQLQEKYT
jgi:hypothetical protein